APVERPRRRERQQKARAARRGHDCELQGRGAELTPQNQAEEGAGQAREDGEQERCRDVDPERAPDLGAESRPDHSSSFMLASNMPTSNGGAHSPVMFRGLHYHPSSGSPRTAGPPPRDVLRLALPLLCRISPGPRRVQATLPEPSYPLPSRVGAI